MKLWEKGYEIDEVVERYTVGEDYILDQDLLGYDCLATKAHVEMLHAKGLLETDEKACLVRALDRLIELDQRGEVRIRPEDEDCHTVIEAFLTAECGEAGKRVHTARSRNDQVLTALRLYQKDRLVRIRERIQGFVDLMRQCSPRHLTVYGRFTRRGGIDINPFRSNSEQPLPNRRTIRQ